jgi:autotransporter-associated beta strand protein
LACGGAGVARAATPVIAQNMAGFEGLEEATVIYHPATNFFENDPTNFVNMVDTGPTMIRTTLRNYYPTLGWWDGDRATTNDDRQRTEVKGIDGLAHQKQFQTYEYSFDFRMNPGFAGTSNFCHIFQLKQTENGSSGSPLVTVSLYKSGGVTQGRIQATSEGRSGTDIVRTFSFTPNTWNHVVVRITPTDDVATTGSLLGSINGDAFSGLSNISLWSDDGGGTNSPSDDYRTKFGFYRSISTSNGVPTGDSWIDHRTVTGYAGASNSLKWKGGSGGNIWDNGVTLNFLNGAAAAVFNAVDQVTFDDSTANNNVTIAANVAPGYVRVNAAQNYTFAGSFGITGGGLRKDGNGTLTLATTNSYPGLTDMRGGTLLVTGSIGNNSLASLTGGTLRAGSTAALGTNSTIGTEINGGTLDINGFNLTTEPVSVQGAGVSAAGAIVNTGAQQTTALTKIILTGDTTLGGSGRWDVRGSGAILSTGGNAYNLTKTGASQICFVATNVDAALGAIAINQGILSFQTSTTSMGDPTKTVTVASGASLGFYNTSAVMSKVATLNGGAIYAESGTGNQNTFAGPISLTGTGGTLNADSGAVLNLTGAISGPAALTKIGAGTATLSGSNTYTGATNVNAGTLVLARSFTANSAVAVANGATMRLAQSATTPNNVVLKMPSSSTINGTGKLDLTDNKLIVTAGNVGSATAGTYSGVTGLIQSGRAGGGGIISSLASGNLTTLGVATAQQAGRAGGTFGGVSVGAADVLVMYTYAGDANVDGKINVDDYGRIDLNSSLPISGWFNGDFNYDGKVNVDDYGIIDFNVAIQGPPISTSASLTSLSAVPEPTVGVPALVASIMLRRRRRRRAP